MARVDYHLNAQEKGLARAAIILMPGGPRLKQVPRLFCNDSGCGAFVKEYGQMLKNDALYADKARQVSELAVRFESNFCARNRWKTGNSRR